MASREGGGCFCAAFGCNNTFYGDQTLSFFRFPKDEDRCRKWVINSRRADLDGKAPSWVNANCRLCSIHFEENQFMNQAKKKLVWNAIPTIFNVPNPPKSASSNRKPPKLRTAPSPTENPTPVPLMMKPTGSSAMGPGNDSGKEKLRREVQRLRMTKVRLQQKINILEGKKAEKQLSVSFKSRLLKLRHDLSYFLSGAALDFIMCQVREGRKEAKGRRWSLKEKALALSLLHTSPKTYRMLRRLLCLPSVATLQREMQQLQVYPGFSDHVFDALRQKTTNMSCSSKMCAIILDEMSLKEGVTYNVEKDHIEGYEDFGSLGRTQYIANHAIVFMVRGLCEKWKQPVGYFLSSGPMEGKVMTQLLKECIDKVQSCNLTVKLVISDQGSNNRSMFETELGASVERPYFWYNDLKILVMYDPPHLIKNIRNNFKKHGFLLKGDHVLWKYVEDFYHSDCKLPIRMAPKLTDKHIELPPFANLRVRLATQVLSHSVAAGITTMVSIGALPSEAQATAEFIENMDKLFNCFNSQCLTSATPFRYAISANSDHIAFLTECKEWLKSVESLGRRKLPCLSGWQMAINCLLHLWTDLHEKHGFKFLLTNRLNQDCVENLFSVIRGKGGQRDNPDPTQFRIAFRQVMVDAVMIPSKSANCQEDLDSFLLTLTKAKDNEQSDSKPAQMIDSSDLTQLLEIPDSVKSVLTVSVQPSDVNVDDKANLQETNILAYIAGYICRKIRSKICNSCKQKMIGELDPSNKDHAFLSNKHYAQAREGLLIPSVDFLHVIKSFEKKFVQVIAHAVHADKVRTKIVLQLNKLRDAEFLKCVQCEAEKFAIGLFVTMRLHHALKLNNRKFSSTNKLRRNRKTMKFSHV